MSFKNVSALANIHANRAAGVRVDLSLQRKSSNQALWTKVGVEECTDSRSVMGQKCHFWLVFMWGCELLEKSYSSQGVGKVKWPEFWFFCLVLSWGVLSGKLRAIVTTPSTDSTCKGSFKLSPGTQNIESDGANCGNSLSEEDVVLVLCPARRRSVNSQFGGLQSFLEVLISQWKRCWLSVGVWRDFVSWT